METLELFRRLSVALGIGLLIGLERGWQARADEEGERAAGLRTHALAALLGAVWGAIGDQTGIGGAVSLGLAFVVYSAAMALFRYRETERDETFGATTVVGAMLAFALGAYAMIGDIQVAGAAGVATASLLALKRATHGWLRRITWDELRSGLILLAMTVVLLPLLPDRALDPWGAVNPFRIWLLTVMIACLSFFGYVVIKATGGASGVAMTGIAGGLASSTAATVTLAKLAREHVEHRPLFVGGALLSGATMTLRVLAIVALVDRSMLSTLAPPFACAAVVMIAAALLFMRRAMTAPAQDESFAPHNPLDMGVVVKFGLLLTAISALSRLATHFAGAAGAYVLAAISGLADVDAITLSMADLDRSAIPMETAAKAIGLAVAVNTLAKCALTFWIGGARAGWRMTIVSVLAILCAILSLLLRG
ncbi:MULTISPECIES: MgtC/SapB family protein [Methylosinus]|uniref:Uncharacterized protein n=1 Tax=Methylosinus trichosporium (strain ATCC 35070 / NCIMB 11131 / UNIQEM 75 / OB3b) TaxID=595536 RepID=A0A2D2CWF9_METT3|nr:MULTISPECIES: MgtC/SapB family protein [Methylosinus]ATQ67043.1 hypothetical protein CQW49_03445 [Methylosinus trichosporium OB3b]OBS50846.1 hypothetical protein A8B73_19385 [Methylosinus sp. 3S-1]